jgi:Ca2+:H+ antiporter
MLGSILSNTLLVLGCCFIAGGINRQEQNFNKTVASTMSSLMAVASASLIIPATLYAVIDKKNADVDEKIMMLSRGTAIILLIIYVLYLIFQLKTHANLFDDPTPNGNDDEENAGADEEEHHEEPQILSPWAAAVALVVITVMVSICAEYLVSSIEFITESGAISETFIGLILIPIVGNAAEHVTAVVVSYKNKMDLALGVAIGSSMQIALFVTPFLVILGWIMGQPMTLKFETFETVVFFISVLIVNCK